MLGQIYALLRDYINSREKGIKRSSKYLTAPVGTAISPVKVESIGWPPWGRFMQFTASEGTVIRFSFAKDIGTIDAANPASWGVVEITGPDVSPFIALPCTGQFQMQNSGAEGFVSYIILESLGGPS